MSAAGDASTPLHRGAWKRYLVLAGLAVFLGLGWHFGWDDARTLLVAARKPPLVWMTLLLVAGFWVRAWKWHYALGPGRQGVAMFFLAKMAGNWSPARSGELAPLLLKRHRSMAAAAWILLDRAVEAGMTLFLGLLGLLAIPAVPKSFALGALALGVIGGAAGLAWAVRASEIEFAGTAAPGWRGKAMRLARALRAEVRVLGKKSPGILLITLAAKATDLYAVVLLCRAFGHDVRVLLVCAARCAHALVSNFPLTPDATGVPFGASAFLLREYGGVPYETLFVALSLEFFIINAVLCLSFGATLLIPRLQR